MGVPISGGLASGRVTTGRSAGGVSPRRCTKQLMGRVVRYSSLSLSILYLYLYASYCFVAGASMIVGHFPPGSPPGYSLPRTLPKRAIVRGVYKYQ